MKKTDSLRAALTAALPELASDTARLQVFIDKGAAVATGAQPSGPVVCAFEYRYRAQLLLLDFAGDADVVFLTILTWARVHQRQLLDRYVVGDREAIKFEADILDDDKVDLSIELDLSEKVTAVAAEGGGHVFTHHEEVPAGDADDWVGAPLVEVIAGGETLLGGDG